MKNILFLLPIMATFCFSQNEPKRPLRTDYLSQDGHTTTEMNAISSPVEGAQIYNETTKSIHIYNGTVWVDIGGGGSSSGDDQNITGGTYNKTAETLIVTIEDGTSTAIDLSDIATNDELDNQMAANNEAAEHGFTPNGSISSNSTQEAVQEVRDEAVSKTDVVDDDTFATVSATTVPSSESVKAYVDANGGGSATDNSLSQINQLIPPATTRDINVPLDSYLNFSANGSNVMRIFGNGAIDFPLGDVQIGNDPYDSGWDADFSPPNKNDVYDKIESLGIATPIPYTFQPITTNNQILTPASNVKTWYKIEADTVKLNNTAPLGLPYVTHASQQDSVVVMLNDTIYKADIDGTQIAFKDENVIGFKMRGGTKATVIREANNEYIVTGDATPIFAPEIPSNPELFVAANALSYSPNEVNSTSGISESGSGTLSTVTFTDSSGDYYVRLASVANGNRIDVNWSTSLPIGSNVVITPSTRISTGSFDYDNWTGLTAQTPAKGGTSPIQTGGAAVNFSNTTFAEHSFYFETTATSGIIRVYAKQASNLEVRAISFKEDN